MGQDDAVRVSDPTWEQLLSVLDHADPGIRRIGVYIYRCTGGGSRPVQLSYAKIERATGMSRYAVRSRLHEMERLRYVRRQPAPGQPAGEPRDSTARGDYYAIETEADVTTEVRPADAGETKEEPGGADHSAGRV